MTPTTRIFTFLISFLVETTTMSPQDILTVEVNVSCSVYLSEAERDKFLSSFKKDVARQLRISTFRIRILSYGCGSVIINMTIEERDSSTINEPTKAQALASITFSLNSGLMVVTLYDGKTVPAHDPKVLPRTTTVPPPKTTKKPDTPLLTTNWVPLALGFITASLALLGLVLYCVYRQGKNYKEKIFTDINCNRPKKVKDEEISEEEKIRRLGRRQKARKMDQIMDRKCSFKIH